MHASVRAAAASALALSLILFTTPGGWARGASSRLEGLLVGVDGRAASSMTVQLIDERGAVVDRARVADDGLYSFAAVAPGSYSLGIETADGYAAPVAAPPVRLDGGVLARRDLKLMRADPTRVSSAAGGNYGLGVWWAGLPTSAKVWVVVGIVTFAGITWAALDDEEDAASPTGP